jgi:hypothetical protein
LSENTNRGRAAILGETPKAGSKYAQRMSYPTKGGQVLTKEPLNRCPEAFNLPKS